MGRWTPSPLLWAVVALCLGYFTSYAQAGGLPSNQPYRKETAKPSPRPSIDDKINKLKNRILVNTNDVPARIELAEIYHYQKQPEKVVLYLSAVQDNLPRRGLLFLAQAYHAQKDFLNEIRTLDLMLTSSDTDYIGETMLGAAYSGSGDSKNAVKHYRTAIKINPRYKDAYMGLLKEFDPSKSKDVYERRQILEQMLGVFPNDRDVLNGLCDDYTKESYLQKGIQICEQAIEADPTNVQNHLNLGLNHRDAKDTDLAKKILYHAAKEFSKSAEAQCTAGDLAKQTGDPILAEQYYQAGAKVDPSSKQCQSGLAKTAFETGDYAVSLAAYVKMCRMDHDYVLKLRQAAGALRQKKLDDWEDKFSSSVGKCD